MKTRIDIINSLIKDNDYKSYLEIGVKRGETFNKINCPERVGVDPVWPTTFKGTSDQFFKKNKKKFDLIFIDGLHEFAQVKKDIENSLRCLTINGVIVLHDCLPENLLMQKIPRVVRDWTGEVWKAFVYFRRLPGLEMFVYDCDFGVGVIRVGQQKPLVVDKPTYAQFKKNKKEWMNIRKT